MAERDSNTIILNRPTILLVTGVGVGLLTLTYVLGVQVGKQSAALKVVRSASGGDDISELPASLDEQIKQIEAMSKNRREITAKPHPKPEVKPEAVENKPKPDTKAESKPDTKSDAKAEGKSDGKWTVQLVAASKEKEAKQISEKADRAGFRTITVKEGGKFKVRLAKKGPKDDMEAYVAKLKAKGMEAFAMKVE